MERNNENKRCLCGKDKVTFCDRCNKGTCKDCAKIAVSHPNDEEVLIYHAECLPKKYQKEVKE